MKQIIATKKRSLFASATEDELSVSQILLDLGTIIDVSESEIKKFTWGYKRRRSNLNDCVSCSRAPSSLSPSIQGTKNEIEERRTNVKSEEEFNIASAAAATASPDTPLSFLSSESDEEKKHFLENKSRKKLRKQDMDMVEQLTQSRDYPRGEIENVRKYYNKLEAKNLELNAITKQQVLKSCQTNEEPQMKKTRGMNNGTDFTKNYGITVVPHPQPLIQDQIQHYPFNPITTQFYSSRFGMVNQVGPCGIPDLNLLAEEAFGVDPSQLWDLNVGVEDKRVRFAEARRMRRGLIKIKSVRSACGIHLPRSD